MLRIKLYSAVVIGLSLLMSLGCERKIVVESGDSAETSCFTCHSDQDIFLVAAELQWANSKHASGENTSRNRLNNTRYEACEKCHTHQGFLAREEVTGIPAVGDQFSVIHCFTCHAPHSNGNFSLRITEPVTLQNGFVFDKGPANICATCHQSRRNSDTYVAANVNLSSHWGPHYNNQSDLLSGTNGYEYAGYAYVNSAHTNVATEACIDCHMKGENNIFVGGHSFKMKDVDKGFDNTIGCNVPECHNGEISDLDRLADADFDMDGTIEGAQTEIAGMLENLHVILEGAGLVDADGHPISQTVANIDTAGAIWNFLFVENDQSHGIHNTDYAVGLLKSAINYMTTGDGASSPASELAVGTAASAPVIDGTIDGVWSSATPILITAGQNPGYQAAFGLVNVTMRALSFNNTLYMLAQWTDPNGVENINKKRWGFDAGTWTPGSEDEDRFFVMFDAGDNGTEKADCASMCHQPSSGLMGTTGGGHVDVWHWKAARTNPGNRVDDKWWDGTGRGSDAKVNSLYTDNTQDIGGGVFKPMYMHSTGPAYTGDFLFDADKVAFDSTLDWTGASIPYYVINPAATGSRWDVSAKGVYAGGVWTLEMSRPFNTGNPDDVVLGVGSVQISVAITDNSGGNHSGTVPFILNFGGMFAAY